MNVNTLPEHGRIDCTRCFASDTAVRFDVTQRAEDGWRITANPMAWGSTEPEVMLLGFSKGPTQAGALVTAHHDDIAYKSHRSAVGKIMRHLGLLPTDVPDDGLGVAVSRLIADPAGRFHFGSLIRCTVERRVDGRWTGTGGNMLDAFLSSGFGKTVAGNCTERFIRDLPSRTKLIVMFGMGSKLAYVEESFRLFQSARGGEWTRLNDVSYTDRRITVVHVEHFASQGALIPKWLGREDDPRGHWGRQAEQTVRAALGAGGSADISPISHDARTATRSRTTAAVRSPSLVTISGGGDERGDHQGVCRLTLTAGNVRNGHFYLERVGSLFPVSAWGGKNALDAGSRVAIRFAGTNERVKTDIDGTKRILRNARGQISRFFLHHAVCAGDQLQITKIGADEYLVEKA